MDTTPTDLRPAPARREDIDDIDDIDVEEIAGFAGQVLTAADGAAYDDARRVFNAMFDRHPRLIARATSPGAVAAAIHHARRHGLTLAVRAGGHSVAGYSSVDGGLVLDLRPLDRITVDPVARVARVGAGVTWGALDRATQAHVSGPHRR